MRRFKRILYVHHDLAHGEAALARAVNLARENGAQLTLAGVAGELQGGLLPAGLSPQDIRRSLVEEREAELKLLLGALDHEGVDVRIKVLSGTPFLEVIKEVLNHHYDLLIKGSEGRRGGVAALLFGSTDTHLLRKCPCPVWIVKPTHHKKYARILAAVDPSEDQHAELNTLIMELATSLATVEQSELHLVHAWTLYGETMLRNGRGHLPKAEVDRLVRDKRKAHKRALEALLARYALDGIPHQVHLLKGYAGDLIPELARKKRVELIVMGTVARTGVPGFLIGNTAERILRKVDCSVLALKPRGFVTPVQAGP